MPMKEITIKTSKKQDIIDITSQIENVVSESGTQNGICFIYNPHTTAGLFINEGADPSVKQDILDKLNSLINPTDIYKHLEGNSHAHIKSVIIGNSLTVFINNGSLFLGHWQSIYFYEGDGPRTRRIYVKILPDK